MIVLESTRPVLDRAQFVQLNDDAIARWAKSVNRDELTRTHHDLLAHLPGDKAQLANLVLLIDALNFCFWSDEPLQFEWRGRTYHRFDAMFISLMLAAKAEPRWSDPHFWLEVPRAEIESVLAGKGRLLLMDDREQIIRETGRKLIDRFDGQFTNAIDSVNHQAWPLAVLLMTNFDSFRDVSRYQNQPVYILKRAQICALDVSCALESHQHQSLDGLEQLTAFADYRLPQALRHLGIMELTADLANSIDTGGELAAGGDAEVEIRATTIQAVDMMTHAAESAGKQVCPWQIDCYLWGLARGPGVKPNHHRTRTVYY
jgi:hypothetical protein